MDVIEHQAHASRRRAEHELANRIERVIEALEGRPGRGTMQRTLDGSPNVSEESFTRPVHRGTPVPNVAVTVRITQRLRKQGRLAAAGTADDNRQADFEASSQPVEQSRSGDEFASRSNPHRRSRVFSATLSHSRDPTM